MIVASTTKNMNGGLFINSTKKLFLFIRYDLLIDHSGYKNIKQSPTKQIFKIFITSNLQLNTQLTTQNSKLT